MRDVAELVEMNRFVGREFLLWLWFESEIYETNLKTSGGRVVSLWLETHLTLTMETEEARIKCPMPAAAPEAKQALQQGKLPKQARVHAILDEHEFAWVMKAEELAVGSLKIPAQLKAESDKYEALYERMRLAEELLSVLEALYADFITLRLAPGWEDVITPELKRWARGKSVDEKAYAALKGKLLKRSR